MEETESLKSARRWSLTKVLITTVIGFLVVLAGVALMGQDVSQLVIAYGTYVTFSTVVVVGNLATKPGRDE